MFNAFYLWLLSIVTIISAIVVCSWVLDRLFVLYARIDHLESESHTHRGRITNTQDDVARMRTRVDSLEKRPPVVHVSLKEGVQK